MSTTINTLIVLIAILHSVKCGSLDSRTASLDPSIDAQYATAAKIEGSGGGGQPPAAISMMIKDGAGSPSPGIGEVVQVTRDYHGDIFKLSDEDCYTNFVTCDAENREAAPVSGQQCRCQCAPSAQIFREDIKQCVHDFDGKSFD